MTPDTITVVIPTYNRAAMVQRAIASVLNETRVPIRVYVLDNASTDETPDVLARLAAQDSRLTYHRHPVNLGSLGNYQAALGQIDTEYFVPLADDDFLIENFLFKAYGIMQADRSLGAAIFRTVLINDKGQVESLYPHDADHYPNEKLTPATHMPLWLEKSHYISWSAILWRSNVLSTIKAPYLHTGGPSDVDFQGQIFCKHNVFVYMDPGAVFWLHPGQYHKTLSMADVDSWARIFERLDQQILSHGLIERDTYLRLRQAMWTRQAHAWRGAANPPPTPEQATQMALCAGFRLGDWPLAFWLAEQAASPTAAPAALSSLPDPDTLAPRLIPGGRKNLALQTITWLRNMLETRQALECELAARTERLVEAEAQIAAASEQIAALSNAVTGAAPDKRN